MTTTLRILSTLEAAGFAERDKSTGRFTTGKSARTLAFAFLSQFPLRDLALPYLQQLTLESGYASSLFLKLGWFAVRAASVPGEHEMTQRSPVGEARLLLEGAPSLAMFAHMSPEDRAQAVRSGEVETLPDEELLASVRERGFLVERCYFEPFARDIAYPILNRHDKVVASVALEGLSEQSVQDVMRTDNPVQEIVTEMRGKVTADDRLSETHYEHVDPDYIRL